MLSATIKILINVLIYTQHSGSADDSVEGIKGLAVWAYWLALLEKLWRYPFLSSLSASRSDWRDMIFEPFPHCGDIRMFLVYEF